MKSLSAKKGGKERLKKKKKKKGKESRIRKGGSRGILTKKKEH